ncbi:class E sortase [Actinobacteria bacterium YIM 96077]|uniref:Class E sortase n=1 Tax=Phytoactinopolyspora halophila TaxID=1981511 RepID=A0A329R4G4_9ACTN|nr:class E sortase [Phytoactinopolyspora halophila]AYY11528.1 class E sortase [Actinobacteria bacterium YIM 96077]RAW17988.1 class E sortase [Phytoactinopolyspora halophila]
MHRKARRGRRRAPKRSPVAVIAGVMGELLLTAGAIVLLFVVYTLWGTGLQTAAAQDDLREEFDLQIQSDDEDESEDESEEPGDLELGDAYGILRIPRFGEDWEWLVVEGVEDDDLRDGPGRYPDNAHAGELGNFAIAGHRSGHGEPFAPFPELHEGDIVEIETRTGIYQYELDSAPNGDPDGNRIEISDSWVVDPVPGEPSSTEPEEARLTLTTCWPRWGSSHRMYASGVLVSEEER